MQFVFWLLSLLGLLTNAPTTQKDYVGVVAAEAAYASLLDSGTTPEAVTPEKKKGPQKDCKTCNGTGRVRSGDKQGWTKCPDCEPDTGNVHAKDAPQLHSTAPGQGWPARTISSGSN